jgi:hypothetical protein
MGIRLLVARSDIGERSILLSTEGSYRWQFDGQVGPYWVSQGSSASLPTVARASSSASAFGPSASA